MKPGFYILLTALILFNACREESKEHQTISTADTTPTIDTTPTPSITMDTLPIDTIFLKDLETAYITKKALWDGNMGDSIPEKQIGMYCMVEQKLKFNNDTIEDYFVTEYEQRFAYSYIIDGRTGSAIPFRSDSIIPIDLTTMFWHRPTFDENGIVPKIVDVNCGDNQEELMMIYTYVGQGISGSKMAIYRFNEQAAITNLIFQKAIIDDSYSFETGEHFSDSTFHIDVAYTIPECLNEITVQEGQRTPSREHLSYNRIKPKEGSSPQTYIFDPEKNTFKLKNWFSNQPFQ